MRNLKRVLSLALALVMVLGMMVITTSAADYTDAEEITYTEAVEVMSAIGILAGNPDGTFAPKGTLTREQAAKILAYVCLGTDADDYLTGSAAPFEDVAADKWSAKYIAFCKNAKIINGVNAEQTQFNPAGTLTTVQFTKMLLAALGIEGTFTGSGWDANVKAAAEKNGLDVITIDHSDITREEACEMALAAMKWTDDAEIYGVYNGTTLIKTYAEAIDAYFAAEALGEGFEVKILPATTYLLNSVYGVMYDDEYASDAYGRPGIEYYDRKTGGYDFYMFYADVAVATYVNTFNKDIVDAMKEANNDVDAFTGAVIKYNGFASDGADEISKLYDGKTPINGMTVELYNLDSNRKTIERVVVIEKNFAVVSDVTLTEGKDAGSVTLTIYAWTARNGHDVTYTDNLKSSYDTYDALCGYTKGTALIVGLDKNWHLGDALMSIEEPTAVEGKITKMSVANTTNSTTVTVDGKTYPMNQMFVAGKTLVAGTEGTLYVDANGCAIGWAGKQGPKAQYAYVVDAGTDSGVFENEDTYYAKLLYTDGTVKTVEVTEAATKGIIVAYAEGTGKDAGKIVLDDTSNKLDQDLGTGIAKNQVTLDSKTANDKTVYVVETIGGNGKSTYTVYTGVTNVPALSVNTGEGHTGEIVGAKNATGTTWDIVFVMDANVPSSTNAANVTYLSANNTLISEVVDNKTVTYYVWDAVINGEITTVKVAATVAEGGSHSTTVNAGLCSVLTYEDGIVTASTLMQNSAEGVTPVVAMVSKTGTAVAKDGVIALGGTSYIYNDSTVVYKVAPNGISLISIGALKNDTNDTVVGYTTDGILTMVVVTSVNP